MENLFMKGCRQAAAEKEASGEWSQRQAELVVKLATLASEYADLDSGFGTSNKEIQATTATLSLGMIEPVLELAGIAIGMQEGLEEVLVAQGRIDQGEDKLEVLKELASSAGYDSVEEAALAGATTLKGISGLLED